MGGSNLALLNPRCAAAFGRKSGPRFAYPAETAAAGPQPLRPRTTPTAAAAAAARGGDDLLSALPDDVLLHVLARLPFARAAARTSVLSRRWRRLWAHLPGLLFPHPADPIGRARATLAAHVAPALRLLVVSARFPLVLLRWEANQATSYRHLCPCAGDALVV
uniref:F-box domain-containing protein n=1 Tax=Arundo donax TaxID=35708 RepID=A0A0A9FRL3_ARUDO